MQSLTLTPDELGQLLFKSRREPRRNAKRFVKDHGGEGSAEELDRLLEAARATPAAVVVAERLERVRAAEARYVEAGVDGGVAEILANVLVQMRMQGLTQLDVAQRCGWQQPQVAVYLSGRKEPGIRNLVKLAAAVGCVWRLLPIADA